MDSGEKPPCLSLTQEKEAREREAINLTVVVGLILQLLFLMQLIA
jgi:hypothetical protein